MLSLCSSEDVLVKPYSVARGVTKMDARNPDPGTLLFASLLIFKMTQAK